MTRQATVRTMVVALLIACSVASVYAQSGVALDAWVRSRDTAENTYDKATIDAQLDTLMNTDGSNASPTVTLEDLELTGDITGVNASFTGDVSAGGVELMKNDGSNAADLVEFQDLNVVASFTIDGVDILGDIDAALTAILGE